MLALQLSGGWRALEQYWCAAFLAGSLLILITCICSQVFMAEVSGVLASAYVIATLPAWSLLIHPKTSYLLREYANTAETAQFISALLPYFLLITGIFASRLFPLTNAWLQTHGILACPSIKLHLALLYSPGMWLLLAALIHIPLFSLQRIHLNHIHMKT
jgi:hypothetical protein